VRRIIAAASSIHSNALKLTARRSPRSSATRTKRARAAALAGQNHSLDTFASAVVLPAAKRSRVSPAAADQSNVLHRATGAVSASTSSSVFLVEAQGSTAPAGGRSASVEPVKASRATAESSSGSLASSMVPPVVSTDSAVDLSGSLEQQTDAKMETLYLSFLPNRLLSFVCCFGYSGTLVEAESFMRFLTQQPCL